MSLMTEKDVADFLRVSVRTVKRLVRSKTLPCYKIGSMCRFTQSHIEEYLTSRETKPEKKRAKPYVCKHI